MWLKHNFSLILFFRCLSPEELIKLPDGKVEDGGKGDPGGVGEK